MRTRHAAVSGLLVLLAAMTATAGAQQPPTFPATPPQPGTPRDFRVPEPRRLTLDNGLEVSFVQWGDIPKVRVTLSMRTGNAFEHADEVWLADLTGDLMREGTTTRTGAQISEEAARMGGALTVSVGGDQSIIGGDVLSEFAPRMIDLVADVVRNPTFPESELPRLKADMARSLSVARSQPQQLALEKFRAVLYGDHPYGRVFPTEEMIAGFTIEQVRRFHTATYTAGRARLYVVGVFDQESAERAVTRAFAGWARGEPARPEPPKPSPPQRAVHVVDRPGAVQSTIIMGLPVVDPTHEDFIPLRVMNSLLGGAFMSRITRNIREDKGYTYSPFSEVSARYRDAYWAQNADVTTAETGAALKEIFGEVQRLQSEPPSAAELRGIQNYLAGSFVLSNSSRAGIAGQLQFVDLHGLPGTYLTDYVKKVQAVTPEQVTGLTKRYIQPDRTLIAIVGDRQVIEEQVKPYGQIAP
jgi:zinc protease